MNIEDGKQKWKQNGMSKEVIEIDLEQPLQYLTYQKGLEFILKNPYAHLNVAPVISKSQQKKCTKGLHTYKSSRVEEEGNILRSVWECIYCKKELKH